jgi:hypothetical protein
LKIETSVVMSSSLIVVSKPKRVRIPPLTPLEWMLLGTQRTYMLMFKFSGANAGKGKQPTLRGQCVSFWQGTAPVMLGNTIEKANSYPKHYFYDTTNDEEVRLCSGIFLRKNL